jgi:hypothetical protein
VLKTLATVFQPLVRLLVEHGISSPETERLFRAVCVREVAKTIAGRGKRPNVSRVALVTGVDRGEVTRILNRQPKGEAAETSRHRVNRVLAGWHSDGDFSSAGRPRMLPVKARDCKRGSFWALARRYAPGVYPGLILSELLRVGAVERLGDGSLRAVTRQYRAAEFSQESVSEIRARVSDLMQTLLNNAAESGWPRICRNVEVADIDPKFLPLIRKMFADRSEATLSSVQEELRSVRWKRSDPAGQGVRVGLTVFTHEEWQEESGSYETGKHPDSSAAKPQERPSRSKNERQEDISNDKSIDRSSQRPGRARGSTKQKDAN